MYVCWVLTNVYTSVIQPPVKICSISLSTFSAPSFLLLTEYQLHICWTMWYCLICLWSFFFPPIFFLLLSIFFFNVKHLICCSFGQFDASSVYYNWTTNLIVSSTLAGLLSWHCWAISYFCRGSSEKPFKKCASSFCISPKGLFTLLAFSSFTVFILLRLVVAGFALFLTLKLFWLAIWNVPGLLPS